MVIALFDLLVELIELGRAALVELLEIAVDVAADQRVLAGVLVDNTHGGIGAVVGDALQIDEQL